MVVVRGREESGEMGEMESGWWKRDSRSGEWLWLGWSFFCEDGNEASNHERFVDTIGIVT